MGLSLKKPGILEFMELCEVTRRVDLMEEFGYTPVGEEYLRQYIIKRRAFS